MIKVYSAPENDLFVLLSQTVVACTQTNQLAVVEGGQKSSSYDPED